MTAFQQLEAFLKGVERRLRALALARGVCASATLALVFTIVLVWFANRYRFASSIVLPLRVLLFVSIAAVLTIALAIPVFRINRRRSVRFVERHVQGLNQRLLTVVERPDASNPFTELLAEDALQVVAEDRANQLTPSRPLYAFLAAAGVAGVFLLWMITAGPGYWGYGASVLWTGSAHAASRPLYEITVQPGNKTVRRRSDQVISAQLVGFSSHDVLLHAKYLGSQKWDTMPMQPQRTGSGYQMLFPGLSDSLEYYVQAGNATSKHFTVAVKDLPRVTRLRVAVHYPSGLRLTDSVQDPGGDIRAVEGSQARISVRTDKPLGAGLLVVENGPKVSLAPTDDGWASATIPISKDGSYHVAASDGKETVRISDDYFIESKQDEAPTVRISHPGADAHVSPIEELPVTVEATDDFGINSLQLRYSVNGGPEQVTHLVEGKNLKDAKGKTTLYFENFKVVPGDLVSLYATANDGLHTSRSEIVFAQAEPFDFKFRQSQQAGGGGSGSGAEQGNNISARQKEIIAATWNEVKGVGKDSSAVKEHARFLSDVEGKLSEQAKTLAARMGNRELVGANPAFEQFSKAMTQASAEMSTAVAELKTGGWKNALPPEQKALQSLLRAESTFRDIQVAYGQRSGGGAGSSGEERELARLFDLELDNSKNQYETGQSAGSQAEAQQKAVEDALQRLKELAKRQQALAEQQNASNQQFQQRWEEEQLRREAEQLRQEMQQQLAQNSQGQQSQSQQSRAQQSQSGQQQSQTGMNAQRSSSSASPSGSSASARQNQEALRRSLDQLKRAEDEMRNAVTNRDASAGARAGNQLAQAQQSLQNMVRQQSGDSVADLAQRARQLAGSQKDLANQVKHLYGADRLNARPGQAPSTDMQRPADMPEMTGPEYAGGWYRRRFMQQAPGRSASEQEKTLAASGEKLAQEMQRLQEQVQGQARSMSGEQPEAAQKLRRAASDAEQEELALRMQKSADWMRQGYGFQTVPLQDSISAGIEQLSRQLNEAQQSASNSKPGVSGTDDEKMLQALSKVQSLRQQLESGPQGKANHGATDEQQQNGALSASPRSQKGDGQPTIGGGASSQDGVNELSALRSQVGRNDRQLATSFNNAIGSLRQVNAQGGLLEARLHQDAITNLQRLELELARRVDQIRGGARTGSPEVAPEQYRAALAEYFRQLSK